MRILALPLVPVLAGATLVAAPATAVTPISTVQWQPCPTQDAPTKECAKLTVPRDYSQPDGATLQIAMARIPATGPANERIGSLFWDAGGPGGSSTPVAEYLSARMSPQIRARFDFVAFDPRGMGESVPALQKCAQPWPVRPARNPTPNWASVQSKSAKALADANRTCMRENRRLVQSLSTNNVVKDLDAMRAAVGDEKLTFWATSYGTRIGYVYALAYPDRVRALVLDGNIDPSNGYRTLARIGGMSQDSALRFMKRKAPKTYRTIMRTTDSLTTDPVSLKGGRTFTRWDWIDLVGELTAFQDAWKAFPDYAATVDKARVPGPAGKSARAFLIRVEDRPNGNEGAGFSTVNCLDYADRLTASQQSGLAQANAKRGFLTSGSLTLAYAIGCAGLGKLDPDPVPLVTTRAQRATLAKVPAILANATHDGSTPMAWAERMQTVFDRPMIRYRGTQHVIWGSTTSTCVNDPIDRFVLTGQLPAKSRTCAFVAPAEQ